MALFKKTPKIKVAATESARRYDRPPHLAVPAAKMKRLREALAKLDARRNRAA